MIHHRRVSAIICVRSMMTVAQITNRCVWVSVMVNAATNMINHRRVSAMICVRSGMTVALITNALSVDPWMEVMMI